MQKYTKENTKKGFLLAIFLLLGFHYPAYGKTSEFSLKSFRTDLEVETVDGKTKKLEEVLKRYQANKPILIYIWASWCPDCMVEAPHLENYLKSHSSDISMLYFSVDKDRKAWLKKKKDLKYGGQSIRFPSGWSDKSFRKSIKLDWIPRYILIDKKAKVIHSYAIKISDKDLLKAIEAH